MSGGFGEQESLSKTIMFTQTAEQEWSLSVFPSRGMPSSYRTGNSNWNVRQLSVWMFSIFVFIFCIVLIRIVTRLVLPQATNSLSDFFFFSAFLLVGLLIVQFIMRAFFVFVRKLSVFCHYDNYLVTCLLMLLVFFLNKHSCQLKSTFMCASMFCDPSLPLSVSQWPWRDNAFISPFIFHAICVSERRGQCMLAFELDLLFFHLRVHCGFHAFLFFVYVNNQAWGNNAHAALGVFLGVLVSKWLSRIACTRPSKHSELCALGLIFQPAIVCSHDCISDNGKTSGNDGNSANKLLNTSENASLKDQIIIFSCEILQLKTLQMLFHVVFKAFLRCLQDVGQVSFVDHHCLYSRCLVSLAHERVCCFKAWVLQL